MFNQTKNLYSIVSLALLILLMASCKKNEEPNPDSDNKFMVEFTDGFVKDKVWVVLHSLDGTLDIETKVLEKGGIIDFGKIVTTNITFSIINADLSYNPPWDKRNFDIESFYNVPVGKYYFNGDESSLLRDGYDLKLSYPSGQYNECFTAIGQDGIYRPDVPEEGSLTATTYGMPYSFFNLYGAVWSDKGGYCNWKLQLNPQEIDSNTISIQLNKPLDLLNITTNLPISYISFNGYFDNRKSSLNIYRRYYSTTSSVHNVFYPQNFPGEEMNVYISTGGRTLSQFFRGSDNIPANINMPQPKIEVEYYWTIDAFGITSIEGQVDYVTSVWGGSDDVNSISWNVYSPISMKTIKRPALSQVVEAELGAHYLWTAKEDEMVFTDFDNVSSYENYFIDKYMQGNNPDFSFTSEFTYTKWMNYRN